MSFMLFRCSEEQPLPDAEARVETTLGLTTPSAMDGKISIQQAYLKLDHIRVIGNSADRVTNILYDINADEPPYQLAHADSNHLEFTLPVFAYEQLDFHLFLYGDDYPLAFTTSAAGEAPTPTQEENTPDPTESDDNKGGDQGDQDDSRDNPDDKPVDDPDNNGDGDTDDDDDDKKDEDDKKHDDKKDSDPKDKKGDKKGKDNDSKKDKDDKKNDKDKDKSKDKDKGKGKNDDKKGDKKNDKKAGPDGRTAVDTRCRRTAAETLSVLRRQQPDGVRIAPVAKQHGQGNEDDRYVERTPDAHECDQVGKPRENSQREQRKRHRPHEF